MSHVTPTPWSFSSRCYQLVPVSYLICGFGSYCEKHEWKQGMICLLSRFFLVQACVWVRSQFNEKQRHENTQICEENICFHWRCSIRKCRSQEMKFTPAWIPKKHRSRNVLVKIQMLSVRRCVSHLISSSDKLPLNLGPFHLIIV